MKSEFVLGVAAMAAVVAEASFFRTVPTPAAPVCWKDTHGRGVGTVPNSCHGANPDKNGALCYPACRQGFYGVGPVCWEYCQDGWIDEGALCRKSGSIETVAKKSYGRTAGVVLMCPETGNSDYDAGLCYPPCNAGTYGVGPVCWESCPSIDPVDGGALCCRDGTTCSDEIKALAGGLPLTIAEAILAGGDMAQVVQDVINAINDVLGFIMPLCDTLVRDAVVE
jgi:hypothetical protein